MFVGEVKLNQTWDDSLNNTNSTEYQALAYDIEAEVRIGSKGQRRLSARYYNTFIGNIIEIREKYIE